MNCQFILITLSADLPIGKVDKQSLSQQTLMELLIAKITVNKEKFCKSSENPIDILEWDRLKFNASNEIVDINASWQRLKGSIDLQWLPLSSKMVTFWGNHLSGTVDLTCLPNGLDWFSLTDNAFEGTVDLTKLPSSLRTLLLNDNRFHGNTDLTQLPESLVDLDVSDTQLEGEITEFDGSLQTYNSKK